VRVAAVESSQEFVVLNVPGWAWVALIAFLGVVLIIDLFVVHRRAHVVGTHEALIETAVWIAVGLAFAGVMALAFGSGAAGEYVSGYLVEMSLSVDNVFVWGLILSYCRIPLRFQHRVLFWGVFGALALRAMFIFAGIALIETFSWILYVFGVFLIYAALKLVVTSQEEIDPTSSRFIRLIERVVPSTREIKGQKLFSRIDGRLVATPLFVAILLVEFIDVAFAIDSIPAVLAVSREQFIVFSSNAFAILGLRALYFLLADAHTRFSNLREGLAIVLAFVGAKMLIQEWYAIPTWLSIVVISIVLFVAIGFSLRADRARANETIQLEDTSSPSKSPSEPPFQER
jgi:tellurite resistance protein TerC